MDIGDDLAQVLQETKPTALVDFTVPEAVLGNIEIALAHGVVPIVGTTGLSPQDVDHVRALCRTHGVGALIAPNFAIGAVLMMRFAQEAAQVYARRRDHRDAPREEAGCAIGDGRQDRRDDRSGPRRRVADASARRGL